MYFIIKIVINYSPSSCFKTNCISSAERKTFEKSMGTSRCFTDLIWICFIIVFVNSILPHSVFCVCVCVFKETDLTDEDAAFSEVTLQFITVLLLIHFYLSSKASKIQCSIQCIFSHSQHFHQLNQFLHHLSKVRVNKGNFFFERN